MLKIKLRKDCEKKYKAKCKKAQKNKSKIKAESKKERKTAWLRQAVCLVKKIRKRK